MDNPFKKRTTEHFRDDVAFLSVVAPEPITRFLEKHAQNSDLYDRPVVICGTPGSGKTTIGRTFSFRSVQTLLQMRGNREKDYTELVAALANCGVLADDRPLILGCRLQLESDYRDFWECPYPESLKAGLMTSLLQARSVIAWLRQLEEAGYSLDDVQAVARQDAEATVASIGGTAAAQLLKRACEVESALYSIVAALLPPPVEQLEEDATKAYQPFDVIEAFRVRGDDGVEFNLRPLAIFDDAHELHQEQYKELTRWLTRREIRVARWLLTRLDVLSPDEVLSAASTDPEATQPHTGMKTRRELLFVRLQGKEGREKRKFRGMARSMADRYLRHISVFQQRGITSFVSLLEHELPTVSDATVRQLEDESAKVQRRLKVSDSRRQSLEQSVNNYLQSSRQPDSDLERNTDVFHAMLHILMHRYRKRTKGPSLFPEVDDPEPSRPVTANAEVFESANLVLLHRNKRPYYYGIDRIADVATENAETFLRLAGELVERSATQLTRGKPGLLKPRDQNHILRDEADRIMREWNFPWHPQVRHLVDALGKRCRETTLQPNGWLRPNSYGVPQEEYDKLTASRQDLRSVLKFGIAWNAFDIRPKYKCKDRLWCILELGGVAILKHGLSLSQGNFIEGSIAELARIVEEKP